MGKRTFQTTKVFVICIVLLIALGFISYLTRHQVASQTLPNTNNNQTQEQTSQAADNPFLTGAKEAVSAITTPNGEGNVFQILTRLTLSVLLAAVLAFRPRRDVPLFQRNLYVAQTQILLAVVAAALMMIVGDNTARAFAIFAAVSLVRFRTNIRDPKEITVLLISLALGLSTGVGRLDLGLALCFFSVVLLRLLEYNEPEKVFRPMELTIKTKNPDSTQNVLKNVFEKFKLESEVRELEPPDEKSAIGSIVYFVNLRLNLSTDYLNDLIMSADHNFIEGIQWSQKKSGSSIYQ
jgi:hypothetical protein